MQSHAFISNRQFPGSKDELLYAMLTAFSEMVYVYDAVENHFVFISDNLFDVLGYADHHFLSGTEHIKNIVHPDDLPEVSAATLSLFKKRDKGAVKCNVRIMQATGQYRWFSIRQVIFARSPTGEKVKYIFGIAVDINGRKLAEERIRAQNRAISEYVFAASHIVRAPLSNILAITGLFDELPSDNIDEFRTWAKTLKEQAEKLDGIIQDMVKNISPTNGG